VTLFDDLVMWQVDLSCKVVASQFEERSKNSDESGASKLNCSPMEFGARPSIFVTEDVVEGYGHPQYSSFLLRYRSRGCRNSPKELCLPSWITGF